MERSFVVQFDALESVIPVQVSSLSEPLHHFLNSSDAFSYAGSTGACVHPVTRRLFNKTRS